MRRGTGTVPHKANNGAVPCLGRVIDALFPQREASRFLSPCFANHLKIIRVTGRPASIAASDINHPLATQLSGISRFF